LRTGYFAKQSGCLDLARRFGARRAKRTILRRSENIMPANQIDNQNINNSETEVPSPPLTPKKIIFIAAFLIGWLAVAFVVWYVHNNPLPPKPKSDFSAKTQGVITETKFYDCRDVGDCSDVSTVHYKFSVNGVDYRKSFSRKNIDYRDKFPVNKSTTVCYDPNSPNDAYLLDQNDEKECGQ